MRNRLDLSKYQDWFDYFYQTKVKNIKKTKTLFVVDCDGVLTDGRHYYDVNGKFAKSYGSYDKEAISFLTKYCGDSIFFVSDDKAGWDITEQRMKHLSRSLNVGNQFGYANMSPKERAAFITIKKIEGEFDEIVFIGDSLSDINAMSVATWVGTTKNSPSYVDKFVDYKSLLEGGKGAFADIVFYYYEYYPYLYKD